jgi:hypothetical protein
MYVRFFKSDKVIKTTVEQSRYFPFPMRDSFRKLRTQRNLYIVCPIFSKGDFQVGITGKMEERETSQDAVYREVGEEVGLVPKKINFINTYVWKNDITFYIYNINIKDCVKVLNTDTVSRNEDTKHKKVGCFVYGEEDDVVEYLKSPIINVYKNNDDIIGIAGVRIGDVKMYM